MRIDKNMKSTIRYLIDALKEENAKMWQKVEQETNKNKLIIYALEQLLNSEA